MNLTTAQFDEEWVIDKWIWTPRKPVWENIDLHLQTLAKNEFIETFEVYEKYFKEAAVIAKQQGFTNQLPIQRNIEDIHKNIKEFESITINSNVHNLISELNRKRKFVHKMDKDRYNFLIEKYDNKFFVVGINRFGHREEIGSTSNKNLAKYICEMCNINGHFQLMRKYFKMFDLDDPVSEIEFVQKFLVDRLVWCPPKGFWKYKSVHLKLLELNPFIKTNEDYRRYFSGAPGRWFCSLPLHCI